MSPEEVLLIAEIRSNIGHALETAVFIELERRRASVTYVRTPEGREVDFLARSPGGDVELIQVCADAAAVATLDRELRALKEAGQRYPGAVKRILTLTQDAIPAALPKGIVAQPAYEWMLRS